ncbi:MAG: hypothetical protein JRJ14_08710, partial [Deltaproteobacteria bacterium]|nr:hypothetical protein [Deltaproteobacteria bacterium]
MRHIPLYLRQLGVQTHPALKAAIEQWNDARYGVEEFSDNPLKCKQYKQKENAVLKEIQTLIQKNADVQGTVLEAVRAKIRDFQYLPESIPFEIFQNADDAVVELERIRSYPEEPQATDSSLLPPFTKRFVLHKTPQKLLFMHWGRPINHTGSGGFPGREYGYQQDLEKMLVFSSSDKQSRTHVTGKFGLGFKSVFLACESPHVVSGRLAFSIVAGLYPQKLADATGLRKILRDKTPDERLPGTLIHLSLDLSGLEKMCDQFTHRAGFLAVFAKQIRKLEISISDRSNFTAEWVPHVIDEDPEVRIETGTLLLDYTPHTESTHAIHLRFNGGGGLLLATGPRGCRPLPSGISSFWVITPTQEDSGIGFAINGNFEVDAGRARLSGNQDMIRGESKRLGRCLAHGLTLMFDYAANNWHGFTKQLNMEIGLQPYDFWLSIWETLSSSWINRAEDNSVQILRDMMTAE